MGLNFQILVEPHHKNNYQRKIKQLIVSQVDTQTDLMLYYQHIGVGTTTRWLGPENHILTHFLKNGASKRSKALTSPSWEVQRCTEDYCYTTLVNIAVLHNTTLLIAAEESLMQRERQ